MTLRARDRNLPPICILAGGLGSRLGDVVRDVPKPLVPVAGRPFLFHQLELLRRHGARRVVVCVGYLGHLVEDAVGDGSDFGLDVEYSEDGPTPIGTAGAVRKALPQLGERFMVLYGDTYLRIDYAAVARAASASRLPALMTVLRNEGRWDTSNVRLEGDRVASYSKSRPSAGMTYIDYGLSVMEAEAVSQTEPQAPDLAALFSTWARRGRLAAYLASERFFEIGTPSALIETDAFFSSRRRGRRKTPRFVRRPACGCCARPGGADAWTR